MQLLEGDAVWKAGEDARYSKAVAYGGALAQRHAARLTAADGRTQDLVASGQLRELAKKPAAYFIEYRDGLKATMLMLDGALKDFNFAARLNGVSQVQSTQFLLTPEPNVTYSACLMQKVEQMFASGAAPYPVERTLLVSGMLESCLTSRLGPPAGDAAPERCLQRQQRSARERLSSPWDGRSFLSSQQFIRNEISICDSPRPAPV
jgi:hypothetical protein